MSDDIEELKRRRAAIAVQVRQLARDASSARGQIEWLTRQLDGIEAELLRDEASLSRLDRLIQKAEVAP